MLEENLKQNGCRDSIVLWGDILIDGHNRYELCNKHGIPFNTIDRDFKSREEALIWIISTQVSRRNLSPIQLSHFRGLHYMADKKIHGDTSRFSQTPPSGQNDHMEATATRLSSKYRVSPKTIRRDAKAAAAIEAIGKVSDTAKKMILSGEVAIDKVKLRELSECPKEELKEVTAAIENGTYEKRPSVSSDLEIPIASILSRVRLLQLAINNLSASFSAHPKFRSNSDRTELKTEIRSCIDRLEELYGQIP